jgi:hypothetical protein
MIPSTANQLPKHIQAILDTYPDRRTVPALESLYRDAIARDERARRKRQLAKERRLDDVSGIPLPRRLAGAPEPAKALTPGVEAKTAATGQPGQLLRQIGRRL